MAVPCVSACGSRESGRSHTRRHASKIWLGLIGTIGSNPGWYVDGAVDFVQQAARTVTRRDGGLPLAAMPLVGTGEGGGVGDKGGLHKELFTNLIPTAAEEGIDVAVVCFDRRQYAAAQRARQHAIEQSDRGARAYWLFEHDAERLHARAHTLADSIRAGQCALFVGSGASAGAGLPTWSELLARLNESLRVRKDGIPVDPERLRMMDPRDQASVLEYRFSRSSGETFAEALCRELETTS
jgi:hypothetical protein